MGAVLAVCIGFAVLLLGSSLKNTVQVFFAAMAISFGQSRGSFALATTLFALTYAVAAPVAGVLAERIGPTRVLHIGILLSGGVFLLCATAGSFPLFVVAYGVLASFAYAMLSYVPAGIFVDRMFAERKRGFFYALLTNGTAGGFILLVPLWTWLAHYTGWQEILIGLAVFLLVAMAPVTLLLSRRVEHADAAADAPKVTWQTTKNALRSSVFIRLALSFFACGASMAFIDTELMPYLSGRGITSGMSSAGVALLGACEIGGALIAGALCDRDKVKQVLVTGYLLRGASLLLIALPPTALSVVVFSAVFGVSYLMTVVGTSLWVIKSLPKGTKGVAMGLVWTLHQIGAALSIMIGNIIYDADHTYVPAIVGLAVVAFVSTATVLTIPGATERTTGKGEFVQASASTS
ncbi:MAG TPA: MFS transporter [Streptosporangiaceae bacterium]|nr:MFS transporter [Streptosporangiaceae bacterium]